jgi:hypothetical protein
MDLYLDDQRARREYYVQQAQLAERSARETRDAQAQGAFEKLAAAWRELAQRT